MLVGKFMTFYFDLNSSFFRSMTFSKKAKNVSNSFNTCDSPLLQISSISKQSINEFHGWRNSISSKLFINIFEMDFQRKMLLIRLSLIHPFVDSGIFYYKLFAFLSHQILIVPFSSAIYDAIECRIHATMDRMTPFFPISPFIIIYS